MRKRRRLTLRAVRPQAKKAHTGERGGRASGRTQPDNYPRPWRLRGLRAPRRGWGCSRPVRLSPGRARPANLESWTSFCQRSPDLPIPAPAAEAPRTFWSCPPLASRGRGSAASLQPLSQSPFGHKGQGAPCPLRITRPLYSFLLIQCIPKGAGSDDPRIGSVTKLPLSSGPGSVETVVNTSTLSEPRCASP